MSAPPAWGGEPTDTTSKTFDGSTDVRWWDSFHDAELSSLVGRLAAQNLDLRSAAERVQQARASRQIVQAQRLPSVDANASYGLSRVSPNGVVSLEQPSSIYRLQYNVFSDGLTASWDLDLFGRVRHLIESADANTQVAIEARRGLALAAVSDLAESYVDLRGLQAREATIRKSQALAEQNLLLIRQRFKEGVNTTLDVANAEAQIATIAATLPDLAATEAQRVNAIGLLLGEPPRTLLGELQVPSVKLNVPIAIPVGLPGELVRRRPDIRNVEAMLRVATAETGVAVADFYPSVSLTGNVGLQGLHVLNAFSLPSHFFDVGPTITVPIFRGGQLRGTLKLRESQQREAVLTFQQTVLNAWREVDDGLTAYAQAQRRRAETFKAVQQNTLALDAARQSYSQGAADFLNVISAQQNLVQSELALVIDDTEVNQRLITLYRALGGGWETLAP
jgi:NodT family efflux transporter outer membrane factor (OMF) lipoprotein